MNTLAATVLLLLADGTPEPKDVKAGWLAFGIFLALVAATALLGVSLASHLRKASGRQIDVERGVVRAPSRTIPRTTADRVTADLLGGVWEKPRTDPRTNGDTAHG